MQIARQTIVTTEVPPSELRRVFEQHSSQCSWRLLWLKKDTFLSISWSSIPANNGEVEPRDILGFVRASDKELFELGRVAATLHAKNFRAASMGDRFANLFDGVSERIVSPKGPAGGQGVEVPTLFAHKAAEVLVARPNAVRIFFDGTNSSSPGRAFSEFFRVVEAGFGVKGSRLQKPLLKFLSSGEYPIGVEKWQALKSIRDHLNHAYRVGEFLFDIEAAYETQLMKNIAADVLVHKVNWGETDPLRNKSDFWRSRMGLEGEIVITRGAPLLISGQILDPVTGIPIHLGLDELNKNYVRYARLIYRALSINREAKAVLNSCAARKS